MDRMDDLTAFLTIVEKGSQTAAARHLRRSLQSINRSLTTLECSVGVELISRTTRQSNPTEAGLAFYRRIKPALMEINDARLEAANRRAEPSGLLRIGAPVLFAPAYVAPVVCDFLKRNPKIEIELKVSDRQVDLLEQGLDLAVRIREMPDSKFKVRRIGELRVVVFGAPAYFSKHGRPRHPDELAPMISTWRDGGSASGAGSRASASAGAFGRKVPRQPTLQWQVRLESDSRPSGRSAASSMTVSWRSFSRSLKPARPRFTWCGRP